MNTSTRSVSKHQHHVTSLCGDQHQVSTRSAQSEDEHQVSCWSPAPDHWVKTSTRSVHCKDQHQVSLCKHWVPGQFHMTNLTIAGGLTQAIRPLMQTACHCHMALFQPAITVIVDWALQIDYLSISWLAGHYKSVIGLYHGWQNVTHQLSVYIMVDWTLQTSYLSVSWLTGHYKFVTCLYHGWLCITNQLPVDMMAVLQFSEPGGVDSRHWWRATASDSVTHAVNPGNTGPLHPPGHAAVCREPHCW